MLSSLVHTYLLVQMNSCCDPLLLRPCHDLLDCSVCNQFQFRFLDALELLCPLLHDHDLQQTYVVQLHQIHQK
jgi:hypothetical protein